MREFKRLFEFICDLFFLKFKLLLEFNSDLPADAAPSPALPVLFHVPQHVRAEQSQLQALLAQVSGELHFTARTMDMVDNDELEAFWRLLEESAIPSGADSVPACP